MVKEALFKDCLNTCLGKCEFINDEYIAEIKLEENIKKDLIYLITTSVGIDISNSVGISWHCNEQRSQLVYWKEGSNELIKAMPHEEYWSIEESYISDDYDTKRYVCSVNLTNLDANTKYYYRIIFGNVASNILTFKTATSKKYSFLSFADFQYSKNSKTLDLVKTFKDKNPLANLITCSGDIADEGYSEKAHRHLFDDTVFSSSILAFGVGDHEYWGTNRSPVKMFSRPHSFNKLFNNPKNGCEDYLNSSYYFKYNTTLFVFLDCGDSNVCYNNVMFNKQAAWLDNLLINENDYDFIIVCMHKSLYGDPEQDGAVRKFASTFTKIFDKHKVDLVISGHDHEYSRTKSMVDSNVKENGTIYLDLGSSGSKTRTTGEIIKTSNLYDKYIDIKEKDYSLGIVGTVENNKLIIEVRNQDYLVVDSLTILRKKR